MRTRVECPLNMLMREKEMTFHVSVMDLVAPMLLALAQSIAVMSVEFSWLSGIQTHVLDRITY